MMKGLRLIFFFPVILLSCTQNLSDIKSLYQWINDPDNGMVKSRSIEGIKLTVKYLPAEYLAYKEAREESADKETYDSLLNFYKRSHTFLLTIASQENEISDDPMYKNIENYPQYRDRAITMNFDMSNYIFIKTTSNEYRPILSSMENTYSLKGRRNIYLVFADDAPENKLMKEKELDFVFNDEIFNTGINHFVFDQQDLKNIPAINF